MDKLNLSKERMEIIQKEWRGIDVPKDTTKVFNTSALDWYQSINQKGSDVTIYRSKIFW